MRTAPTRQRLFYQLRLWFTQAESVPLHSFEDQECYEPGSEHDQLGQPHDGPILPANSQSYYEKSHTKYAKGDGQARLHRVCRRPLNQPSYIFPYSTRH